MNSTLICVFLATVIQQQPTEPIASLMDYEDASKATSRLTKGIWSNFKEAKKAVESNDVELALFAAFFCLKEGMERTEDNEWEPSEDRLDEYFARLEEICQVKIPDNWVSVVGDCSMIRGNNDSRHWEFPVDNLLLLSLKDPKREIDGDDTPSFRGVSFPNNCIFQNGDVIDLTYKEHKYRFPNSLWTSKQYNLLNHEFTVDRLKMFWSESENIAIFHSDDSDPYKVLCFSPDGQKIKWINVGLAAYEGTPITGEQTLTVAFGKDAVWVFGMQTDAIYIECFDKTTGVVRHRFASNGWGALDE